MHNKLSATSSSYEYSWLVEGNKEIPAMVCCVVGVVDSHIQRIVLATEETTVVTRQVSHIDLSNVNPAACTAEIRWMRNPV